MPPSSAADLRLAASTISSLSRSPASPRFPRFNGTARDQLHEDPRGRSRLSEWPTMPSPMSPSTFRGSSTRPTTDAVFIPLWAISARNSSRFVTPGLRSNQQPDCRPPEGPTPLQGKSWKPIGRGSMPLEGVFSSSASRASARRRRNLPPTPPSPPDPPDLV